jgi:hypothetical protein
MNAAIDALAALTLDNLEAADSEALRQLRGLTLRWNEEAFGILCERGDPSCAISDFPEMGVAFARPSKIRLQRRRMRR